jgi:hypothetical protein
MQNMNHERIECKIFNIISQKRDILLFVIKPITIFERKHDCFFLNHLFELVFDVGFFVSVSTKKTL